MSINMILQYLLSCQYLLLSILHINCMQIQKILILFDSRDIQQYFSLFLYNSQFITHPKKRKKMLASFPSSSSLLPRRTQQHLFTSITIGQDRYRVLTRDCNDTINALTNLQVFWIIISFIQISALFDYYTHFRQGLVIFICAFVVVTIVAILAIHKHKKIIKMLLYSLVNLSLYLCSLVILTAIQCKQLIIPTSIYITSQILASMALLQDRSKLMPKFLIMLQLLILILKLDDKLNSEWAQVYFGFLLACFIAIVVLVSMILFLAVNVLYFNEKLISVKHIGLGFIFSHALSSILATMLPLAQPFFKFPFTLICLIGLLINLCTILYGKKFNFHIIMFMCKVEKVKQYNQIISLIKIPNQSISQYVFTRKSQNWYERITKQQLNQQIYQNKQNTTKQDKNKENSSKNIIQQQVQNKIVQNNKCLICLQIQACMIWMPCGHLTVCEICCDKMFENKSCNCLLCKDIPQAVYHMDVHDNCKQYNFNDIMDEHGNGNIYGSKQNVQQIQCQQDIQNKQNNSNSNSINSNGINNSNNKCKQQIKQLSTKDFDTIQNSLSGQIYQNQNQKQQQIQINAYNKYNPNVLQIKYAYSIRIN